MATPVTMPQMGYDMTEGSIQTWVKKEGDKVSKGETIAEIETDKATVEMEAFANGILKKIVVQPGQLVPVGTVVAVIADENEEVDWKALGLDGSGGGNMAAVEATSDTASDAGATRKSAGEGGESLSPDASISLQEVMNAAPKEQRLAEGKAATDGTERAVPATGPGSSTFSRRPPAGLINLAAPISAAGGPGGAAVPSETGEEMKKVGQQNPSAPGRGEGDEAAAQTQAITAPLPQTPAAPVSNGSGPANASSTGSNGRVKSSPLARKVAGELGVEISAVSPTGPGGRVVRADVENYAQSAPAATVLPPTISSPTVAPMFAPPEAAITPQAATVAAPLSAPALAPGQDYVEQPLSRMRQTIARRMTEAKQNVPHFYVSSEIDMTEALKLRQTVNGAITQSGGSSKVSVNDMVLKAVAKALRKYPALNNSYVDGKIRVNSRVNIAVAVALEDGLITPVVPDVDQKSIGQVAAEARALAEKARAGTLRPEEFQGGTFTVSNLGMFDVSSFVAIINPPQAAILAVGSTKPTVVVKSGSSEGGQDEFEVIQQMSVTLSADHRATDGAVAAQFLQELKRILQNPLTLLV